MTERIFKLTGKVQHYAWGGFDFLPEFLQKQKDNKPWAEYWLGAHPSASSTLELNGELQPLYELIKQNPSTFIGEDANSIFGELPYLLKVLDVKQMLSIQVHPSKEEALKGFEAEEAAGIPINASNRNYKDKNHKPEVMVALSEFWLLHGFKQKEQLVNTLKSVPEFTFLLPVFESEGYQGLYATVMQLPQQKVDDILLPLVERTISCKQELLKEEPGYWVSRLYEEGEELTNLDKGIFSIYFFNIVKVYPGEAVFQGAGIPHAYLEGQNVELMANSDNVLRGGLTPKHIDVQELMKHTTFEGIEPRVMKGDLLNDVERTYPCPVADFGISSIEIDNGHKYTHRSSSAEIYLVGKGSVEVGANNHSFKQGEAFFVIPSTDVELSGNERSVVYKAFVPAS